MASINFDKKKEIVSEISKIALTACSIVVVKYSGITVSNMDSFRSKAREFGIYVKVVPNSLAKRAFLETEFSCLNDFLIGHLLLIISITNISDGAKVIKQFNKLNSVKFTVKAISLRGCMLEASDFDKLSNLPSRDKALFVLTIAVKSVIVRFVCLLKEPHAKLIYVISKIHRS